MCRKFSDREDDDDEQEVSRSQRKGVPPQLVRGRPLPRYCGDPAQGECAASRLPGPAITLASLGRSRPLFATAIRADLPFSHPRPGSVQVRCARPWLAACFPRRADG
ncbi:hypothetical protein PVAP13_3KG124154 [Panicum virgatum]|uniref:Uncharacterized protein n=1 Tax=Panicum virgatum TaxID=38727 RepID=A0A8T0UNZ4_PANVG|nr:hypothetical protein PVAP13_3KG124154 [Panicum virgatum]